MAVIEVNHQALRNLAGAIEDYCESFYNEMRRADTGVQEMMAGGWVGGFAFCMIMEVMKHRQYKEYMKQQGGKAAKSGGAKKRKK